MPKRWPSYVLVGWIKELLPPGRFPKITDEAKEYLKNILKDRIDKFSLTISGWQYVAAQLSVIAYEYALQREKLSNMIGETEEALIQKSPKSWLNRPQKSPKSWLDMLHAWIRGPFPMELEKGMSSCQNIFKGCIDRYVGLYLPYPTALHCISITWCINLHFKDKPYQIW